MKIEELSDIYIRALFYGDSGAGKTRLLGTAMLCKETSPLLVLNARGQPITFRFLKDNLPLILTVESMKDFNSIYSWIMDNQPLPKALKPFAEQPQSDEFFNAAAQLPDPWQAVYLYLSHRNASRFATLGIDSITQVQRIANDTVMSYDEANARYAADTIPEKRGYTEYQKLLDMLTRFADHHYQLPIHVIMTALCRHSEMPTLGIIKYYPFLWGQAALEVPSYAELVGRLVNIESLTTQKISAMSGDFKPESKDERPFNVLYTQGGRDFIAKWQGPEDPPDLIVNPTVEKVLNVIRR